jgi:uncharacterized protein YndB with AHSA1/START domain/DNA-binding transcriptional ArsR family regulator
MDAVFRALADPSRRLLLDHLFERDGQTLVELCAHLPGMTRFGVMNHLGVLEEAELITVQRVGREKRHYLNPVPIRMVHDRWIRRFEAPIVGRMVAIKERLEAPPMSTHHVHVAYIRASQAQVWDAIVDGSQTEQYYFGTRVESDWEVGSTFRYTNPDGTVAGDGTIEAIERGTSVAMRFQARWDPRLVAEGPMLITWTVEPAGPGISKLTVLQEEMGPETTRQFLDGGIFFILSGLKTLLETGEGLPQGSGAAA